MALQPTACVLNALLQNDPQFHGCSLVSPPLDCRNSQDLASPIVSDKLAYTLIAQRMTIIAKPVPK